MEFKEIQDLLKLVNKSNLTEVEIEQDDFKLRIRKKQPENNVIYASPQVQPIAQTSIQPSPQALPQAQVVQEAPEKKEAGSPKEEQAASHDANLYTFKSPMIGTFYRASSPDTPPFVKVGDRVKKGQVLCIIEAMKLFNDIESEVDGTIVKILLEDSQPVEYDQAMFLIELS